MHAEHSSTFCRFLVWAAINSFSMSAFCEISNVYIFKQCRQLTIHSHSYPRTMYHTTTVNSSWVCHNERLLPPPSEQSQSAEILLKAATHTSELVGNYRISSI